MLKKLVFLLLVVILFVGTGYTQDIPQERDTTFCTVIHESQLYLAPDHFDPAEVIQPGERFTLWETEGLWTDFWQEILLNEDYYDTRFLYPEVIDCPKVIEPEGVTFVECPIFPLERDTYIKFANIDNTHAGIVEFPEGTQKALIRLIPGESYSFMFSSTGIFMVEEEPTKIDTVNCERGIRSIIFVGSDS